MSHQRTETVMNLNTPLQPFGLFRSGFRAVPPASGFFLCAPKVRDSSVSAIAFSAPADLSAMAYPAAKTDLSGVALSEDGSPTYPAWVSSHFHSSALKQARLCFPHSFHPRFGRGRRVDGFQNLGRQFAPPLI